MTFARLFILSLFVCASLATPLFAQGATDEFDSSELTMLGTYYSDKFVGRKTSSGEVFSQDKYTAAHHSFKFGTLLLVTNPKNGSQVIVRVNDRCPRTNVIDMSHKAAKQIGVSSRSVNVCILPQQYYRLWEIQEDILDVLAEGRLLSYAKEYLADVEKKAKQYASSSEEALKLYDIVLFSAPSREAAKKRIARIPTLYRDKANAVKHDKGTNVDIVLEVALPWRDADDLRYNLMGLFPDAKLIVSK